MNKAEIITDLIASAIEGAEISLDGEDCTFTVWIISQSFEGQKTIDRQKAVLALLDQMLRSGDLHAVTVKAYTPDEWANRSAASVGVQIQM